MTQDRTKKNQQLAITLIADTQALFKQKQLFEQLMDSQCTVEYSQLRQLGAQHCLIIAFSGSWEHIAKLELQIKKHGTLPNISLNLLRGQYTQSPLDRHHSYQLIATSEPEVDLSYDFTSFFMQNEVLIVDMKNQIMHNRHGMKIRNLQMRLAVPTDTHLTAMHEAVNELLDDLNADGSFRIEI